MSKWKEIESLPSHLQPRILSAVSYIHVAPNKEIGLERINKVMKELSEREMKYVLSLLVFDKLLDLVADSDEFKNHVSTMKERTIH